MRDRFRSRDKTIFFFMILLIVILLLGIGYAFLNNRLSSNEEEEENTISANYDISFVDASSSGSGNSEAKIDNINPSRASFVVKDLVGYGDTANLEYTIKNEEGIPLQLDIIMTNITNESYFSIESNIEELNKTIINPQEEKTLNITVKVSKVYTGENETIDAKASIIVRAKKLK